MKINYIGCIILTIVRLFDILFTSILLNLGFVETNPLGFNPLSISLVLLWLLFMWILSYYISDEKMEDILFIIIILFITISAVVVGYEIKLLCISF